MKRWEYIVGAVALAFVAFLIYRDRQKVPAGGEPQKATYLEEEETTIPAVGPIRLPPTVIYTNNQPPANIGTETIPTLPKINLPGKA